MADWWRGSVIYQIYPRSFQDTTGNGIGDLAGITRRLDHVASLGAGAIWLSPIFASPMADMGYDVSDYTDIDPLFGTLADFDRLVAEAHARGIRVIIDQVLSHSSDRHPFFAESRASRSGPKADWYVWADPRHDGTPPNNWPSVFGGPAWEYEPRRRQYYLHNFLASQPDWNLHNPEVQDWLLSTMRFWLERGVDGFRLDTVNYYFHDAKLRDNPADYRHRTQPDANPYEMQYHLFSKNQPENLAFLERIRALLDEFDARATVGEVGDSHHAIEIMGAYTAGTSRLHMAYSFDLLGPVFTAAHFRSRVESFFHGAPDGWPCWSFSNHDVNRHVTRWATHGADRARLAKQAAALLLSFPGTICLYQGEELGLPEAELEYHELTDPPGLRFWPENKGRDGCRTPMVWENAPNGGFSAATPWLPVKPPHLPLAVAEQEGRADSVLAWYRAVVGWRNATAAITGDAFRFVDLPEPFLGLWRGAGEDAVLCLFNLSPAAAAFETEGLAQAEGPWLGSALAAGRLTLGANGVAVLRRTGARAALVSAGGSHPV